MKFLDSLGVNISNKFLDTHGKLSVDNEKDSRRTHFISRPDLNPSLFGIDQGHDIANFLSSKLVKS